MPGHLDIQHDPPGFEADGRPVPIVEADFVFFDDPKPEDAGGMNLTQFINAMMEGTVSLEKIGARVVLASFAKRKCLYRPKSLRELADWLGCSHPTAKKKFTTFTAEIIDDWED